MKSTKLVSLLMLTVAGSAMAVDQGEFTGLQCTYRENSTAPDAVTHYRIYEDKTAGEWKIEVAPAKVIPETFSLGRLEQAGSFLISFQHGVLYNSPNLGQLEIVRESDILSFDLGVCTPL